MGAEFDINSLSISDSAAVSISGENALIISGAEGGGGIATLPGAGGLTVHSDVQLAPAAGLVTTATETSATIHGVISGGADLRKDGAGTLTVTAASTYTGETTVQNGNLVVDGGSIGRLEKDVFVGRNAGDDGFLSAVNGGTILSDFAKIGDEAGATGTLNLDGGTLSIRLTLLVGNPGNGELSISNGSVTTQNTFIGTSPGSTGSVTISGGTFASSNEIYVGSEGSGNLTLEGGTVTVGGGAAVVIAELAGSTGTLRIGNGGSVGTLNAASVTAGAGSASVHFDHTGDLVFAPNLTGSLSVTKSGSGTTTFSNAKNYTGSTQINAGRLVVNDPLASPSV